MAKRTVGFLYLVLVLVFLAGCIQVDTVVKVKPDGSGTVVNTLLMSKEYVQQMEAAMKQMMEKMGGKEGEQEEEPFNILDEEELKQDAESMGEGVTYVSAKELETDWGKGYEAIYTFEDINKLKLEQASGGQTGGAAETEKSAEYITFQFTKGDPSILIVNIPQEEPSGETESPEKAEPSAEAKGDESENAAKIEQMKQMFKGMKMAMAVEVEGSIEETNATHREGSKVTLFDVDFGSLVENPEKLEKLAQSESENTPAEIKELLKDVPGIKVELNKEVKISFK